MSGEKLMVKKGTRRGEWGHLAWLCLVQSLRDVRDQIGRVFEADAVHVAV
jgi:hypothetical protein